MDSSTEPPRYSTPERKVYAAAVRKRNKRANISSTVGILLLAPLMAVGLTVFVFQTYQVSGQSMESTLQNQDRLIVWKVARTWSRITGNPYVPARGDVIIAKTPLLANVGLDPNEQIIKRVVGLPGDRIVVKDGVLTVYNATHPNGFQPDQTLPYGTVIKDTTNNGEWTVKANQLFICGDNRQNSADSRLFGPISTDDVIGKLAARVLPLNGFEAF